MEKKLKIRADVDLKELEKFGYMYWNKEDAKVHYFKMIHINGMYIQIFKNREIDFQLPIGSIVEKEDVKLEAFIDDLIQAGLAIKE